MYYVTATAMFLILAHANINPCRSVDQDVIFFKYLSYLLTFKKNFKKPKSQSLCILLRKRGPRAITANWLCTPDSDPAVPERSAHCPLRVPNERQARGSEPQWSETLFPFLPASVTSHSHPCHTPFVVQGSTELYQDTRCQPAQINRHFLSA